MGFAMGMCCCGGPATIGTCLVTGCSAVPLTWEVDLAGGGWTDGTCDYCDQVNGTYLLDKNTGSCTWGYDESAVCTVSGSSHNFQMLMSEAGNKFSLLISIDNGFFGISAYYEYDPPDSPTISCIGPFTFTKISDGPDARCGGALPATITCQAV